MSFQANYFEFQSSRSTAVTVRIDDQFLHIQGEGVDLEIAARYCQFETPISDTHMVVVLPDNARLEISLAKEFYQQAVKNRWKRGFSAFFLERDMKLFTMSFIALICVLVFIFKVVIPASSGFVSKRIPQSWAQKFDDLILEQMERTYFDPSELPEERKAKLLALFEKHGLGSYRIHFRKSDAFKANALALTGDTIVITDELVKHMKNDLLILGIAFHEQGHLLHRHSLKGLVSAAALSMLTLLMGDLAGSPEAISSLGLILVSRSFQRDQESEADFFAAEMLRGNNLPTACFNQGLTDLENYYKDLSREITGVLSYLSTHPQSAERITALQKKYPSSSDQCEPNP